MQASPAAQQSTPSAPSASQPPAQTSRPQPSAPPSATQTQAPVSRPQPSASASETQPRSDQNSVSMSKFNKHIPLLGAKALRLALVWVSAYFAAKTIQDSYIDKVFMKEAEPPSLVNMVYAFVMFQAVFSIIVIGIIATILYVISPRQETILAFAMASLVDIFVELTVTGGVLFFIARVMEKKKFFNYRYEGLRAIRALRTLMFRTAWVTMTIPYYSFFDSEEMMKVMKAMKQQGSN